MSRVFANGPRDRSSLPSRVIPKTQKMVLNAALLNIQHFKVRIKGEVQQSREWSGASLTRRCRSYWKGYFRVTLDNGRQLLFIIIITIIIIGTDSSRQLSRCRYCIDCTCLHSNSDKEQRGLITVSFSPMYIYIYIYILVLTRLDSCLDAVTV